MRRHIAIEVLDSALVDSIRQSLSVMTGLQLSNEPTTIHRVPMRLRQFDNDAYEPRLVSIGPYHHNKQTLEPMEKHKWRYLQAILSRNQAVSLEDYLYDLKALEAQARRSYSESIELDSNEFLKMMLLDGCFIVELFVKCLKRESDGDPIYDNKPLLRSVGEDMLLLENQLPYCLLQCIFGNVLPGEMLAENAVYFFGHLLPLPFNPSIFEVKPYHHLLHLIHCLYLPSTPRPQNSDQLKDQTIPSAESLGELGIKFKRKAEEGSVLDLNFRGSVMKIPYLFLDDYANCLFRNFIAFEQCYPSVGSYFAGYVTFMNFIIKTKADVKILHDERILEHALGNDEEVALLFNKITKGIFFIDYNNIYHSNLLNDINRYCDTRWHRWRASLIHDYFRNPWSVVVSIAAIVVLILTAVQSFYAVYAYARPPHQS